MTIKTMGRLLAVSCATSLVLALPSTAKDLIYSSFLPSGHLLNTDLVVPFTDELREKTSGELDFEISTSGALAGARETLKAVEDGTVDAGYIIDIYTPSALPQTALLSDLSLLIQDAVVATAAMNETVLLDCAECRESVRKHGVEPFGYVSTSVYALQCTKPVTNLADLKGLKVRASSAWAPLIEELGGTPVNIPTSELFEGLQRGALDCSVGPVSHLPSYSLYEVVTDINEMPFGAYAGAMPLNIRSQIWEDMTDAQKAVMLELIPKYVAAGIFGYNETNQEAIDESKAKGINWHPQADDIVSVYDSYKKKVIAAAIVKGEGDPGITDSAALINAYVENLDKWTKIMAKIGNDEAAFAEALRTEIYSKLK